MSTPNLSKTERIDVRASTPVKQLLQEAGGFTGRMTISYNADSDHKAWVTSTERIAWGANSRTRSRRGFHSIR